MSEIVQPIPYIQDDGSLDVTAMGELTDAEKILVSWYNAWIWDEQMPPKVRDAAHVKTIMYFIQRYYHADS